MRTEIETYKKFTIRLEDIIYFLAGIFVFLIGAYIALVLRHTSHPASTTWIKVTVLSGILAIGLPALLIFLSYKKRIKDRYFFENDAIIRERGGHIIFEIPLEKIVSIRINNRKGSMGTILFFTDKESLNYFFSYLPFNMSVPIVLYGLTKFKINLAVDRKKIATAIYKANPKLNLIETS